MTKEVHTRLVDVTKDTTLGKLIATSPNQINVVATRCDQPKFDNWPQFCPLFDYLSHQVVRSTNKEIDPDQSKIGLCKLTGKPCLTVAKFVQKLEQ